MVLFRFPSDSGHFAPDLVIDWGPVEVSDEGGDGDDDDSAADETELDLNIERGVERIVVVVCFSTARGQLATGVLGRFPLAAIFGTIFSGKSSDGNNVISSTIPVFRLRTHVQDGLGGFIDR